MKCTGRIFKRIGSLLLVGALALGTLAGCSGKDSSAGASASSSQSGSSNVKTVKVATVNSMPPYAYLDENGNLTGYDVEVLKAIDQRLPNYSFNIDTLDFNALLIALESKTLDMADCQFVPTAERRQKFLFPDDYYCLSPMVLVVRPDSGIKSLEDMAGKTILTSTSSYEYTMLLEYNNSHPGKEMKFDNVSDITTADMYKMIANGQVDASLSYISTFDQVNKSLGLNLVKTDVVMVEKTYFMFNSDDTELCKAVNQALTDMKKDGTLSQLATKYLGEDIFTKYSSLADSPDGTSSSASGSSGAAGAASAGTTAKS